MVWYFGPEAWGISASQPWIDPTHPALESEVLTTGPPGRSLQAVPPSSSFIRYSDSLEWGGDDHPYFREADKAENVAWGQMAGSGAQTYWLSAQRTHLSHKKGTLPLSCVVLDSTDTWQPLCNLGHVMPRLWASVASSKSKGLAWWSQIVSDVFTDFQKRQCKELCVCVFF